VSFEGEDSVYGRLRTAILSLELVPGERISERSLESLLGASRTPIRAALMRLENEGLTQREGRGWKVAPIDLAEVRAIMEYREAVEVAAVRLAVERADDEELAALRALSEAHRGRDDEETGLRDFSDFHLALARLSGNHFLADGMDGALTRLSRTRWLGVRTPQSRSDARDEHLQIIAAIRARDTDAAVALSVSTATNGIRCRRSWLCCAGVRPHITSRMPIGRRASTPSSHSSEGRYRPSRCDRTMATFAGAVTASTPRMISIAQSAPSVWKTSSMCPVVGGCRLPRRR